MTDYSMNGRTYRYFQGRPLYPFGYGLSYTEFCYLNVSVIPQIEVGDKQLLQGYIQNIGSLGAHEVVQVYISWMSPTETMPQLQLVGFQRLFIDRGATQMFRFKISAQQMAVWTDVRGFVVQPGTIQVSVGGQQPHQEQDVGSNVLVTTFTITVKDTEE